jgi:multiple sugar transport system permease protein
MSEVAQATPPAAAGTRLRRLGAALKGSESLTRELLVLPSRLLLTFAIAIPSAIMLYISFTTWSPALGTSWWHAGEEWAWFHQYGEVLTSDPFYAALGRTLQVVVIALTVETLLGFGLALVFRSRFPLKRFYYLVLILPMMVVPAVAGFIFFMLFQVDGPINEALSFVLPGDVAIRWLTDPDIALYSVIIAQIWMGTPIMFLICLSGLLALPQNQLNASRILGAGFGYELRHLVLPMMKPLIAVALVIQGIETFKLFDAAWLLTKGGPGEASTTISVFFYRAMFIDVQWAFASAGGIIVILVVSLVAARAVRPIERATEETAAGGIPGAPAGKRRRRPLRRPVHG